MENRDDPISVCRVFEKTSKTTGNTYFAGRWGNAKVVQHMEGICMGRKTSD
jgi:hypothetical protein